MEFFYFILKMYVCACACVVYMLQMCESMGLYTHTHTCTDHSKTSRVFITLCIIATGSLTELKLAI